MAERGDDGRHRRASSQRRDGENRRGARRDTLTPASALRATRFTRWTVAAGDITFGGAFFIPDVPTNSATFRAMQNALGGLPMVGPYTGMWTWGLVLVVAGLLIPSGRIALGGPIGAFGWAAFAVFNLLSLSQGALAVGLFASVAALHAGMGWFIGRDRRQRARTPHSPRAPRGPAA